MKNRKRVGEKLIWAVDPFGDIKAQSGAARFTETLQRQLQASVEAVFVLSSSVIPMVGEREYLEFFIPQTREKFRAILKRYKVTTAGEPKILVQPHGFTRKIVASFLSYSSRQNPFAIVTSTQARKGLGRLFLGSFAETLVLMSKIPLFVVGPTARVPKKIVKILFPTDFSDESEAAFHKVLELAKQCSAQVMLFHQFQASKPAEIDSNVLYEQKSGWQPGIDELGRKELARVMKQWGQWELIARRLGVKCNFEIRYKLRNVADATLEYADESKSSIIALAAVQGSVAAAFSGSTSRWIIRSAKVPVWTLFVSK